MEDMAADDLKRNALGTMLDAWDAALGMGIKPTALAEVTLYIAITDLVAEHGEDAAADIMAALPARIKDGEFSYSNEDLEADAGIDAAPEGEA